jgi:hypothetical protein
LEVEQEGLLTPDRLVDVSMGLEVKALSGDAEVRYYFGPDLAQWKLEVNLSQGKEKCNLSPHSQKNTGILDMGEKGIQVVDPTEGIELQIEVGAKSLFSVGENARLERPLEQINKGGGFFIPDMPAMGASMGLGDSILVGSVVDGQKPETGLAQMKMGAHISQCNEKVTHSVGKDGSDGKETASDDLELETQDEEWLMVQEPDTRKENRKKLQVQATRQSLRLRNQGGGPVKEMVARRKQKQNLDYLGTKNLNPFPVLNSMDDDVLLQRTKDLDLRLTGDDVSSKLIIIAIKAEE